MIADMAGVSTGKCELLGRGRLRRALRAVATGGISEVGAIGARKANVKMKSWHKRRAGVVSVVARRSGGLPRDRVLARSYSSMRGADGVELMGKGLFAKIKRAAAAVATGGLSEAALAAKKKPDIGKAITRAVVAVATGGTSEAVAAAKKKPQIAKAITRAVVAVATGGASEAARGLVKSKTARRVTAGIVTGGASELIAKGKSGNIARALATGGASLLFQKNKAGNIARKVAGYVFAPITTSIVGAVKKSKARKAAFAKSEAEAQKELDAMDAEEKASAAGAPAGAPAGGMDIKKMLPVLALGAVALPFLFGDKS